MVMQIQVITHNGQKRKTVLLSDNILIRLKQLIRHWILLSAKKHNTSKAALGLLFCCV